MSDESEVHEAAPPETDELKELETKALESIKKLDDKESDDQHHYDIERQAVDDAAADKDKQQQDSKKWNDDTRSDNWINGKKNISVPAYMQVMHAIPPPVKAFIGKNEYFLFPKRRLSELSADSQEEITRIHGSQVYPILDDYGNIPEHADEGIAIPTRTQNTPRYFESTDIEENFTHDDVFRDNVKIADEMREKKDRNKKRMVL